MRFHSKCKGLLIALLFLAPTVLAMRANHSAEAKSAADKPNAQSPAKPRVLVTISKATTYITEPLRQDGYPDYVAALNQRFSQGVTPENNAAVFFWKAVGPSRIDKKYRAKHFQMLGIPPLPEEGDYFVDLFSYADQQKGGGKPVDAKSKEEELTEESKKLSWSLLYVAAVRPWSKQELPLLADWLASIEKPLAVICEAFERPRQYDPFFACRGDEGLVPAASGVPSLMPIQRQISWTLLARAMLRLQEGNVDGAWEDLLACHRLARLVGQGTTLVEALMAATIDESACARDRTLLQHAKLSTAQVAKMRADLANLPPMPKYADKIESGERFWYLSRITLAARKGPAFLEKLGVCEPPVGSTVKSLIGPIAGMDIDWDIVLRVGNSWFDRLADSLRKPTRTERREALGKIIDDIRNVKKTVENARASGAKSYTESLLGKPRDVVSERIGEVLVCLFIPVYLNIFDAEDSATMTFELTKLAFALAAYRADHNSYPPELADLKPKYIAEVPKDVFNNAELHYRRKVPGYLLYSVGIDGKDDGGKNYFNPEKGRNWDDLVVSMPSDEKQ